MVALLTALVLTAKAADVTPPVTVAPAGTAATAALLLESTIAAPAAGAAPDRTSVPCTPVPPVTLLGFRARFCRLAEGGGADCGVTVSVPVRLVPLRDAVITTAVLACTADVEIVNVPVKPLVEVLQRVQDLLGHSTPVGEIAEPVLAVEHRVELIGGPIADRDHHVGVHDVVDERDVLVADALDVVLAEPVLEHRGALERLDGDDLRAVQILQAIAGGDRAGRAGGTRERGEPQWRWRAALTVSNTWASARPVTS